MSRKQIHTIHLALIITSIIVTLLKAVSLINEITLVRFILNEKEIATDLPPGMVLLDFIRYHQHLVGTKIGCREGDCGACTVLVGEISRESDGKNGQLFYQSMTCCLMPLGNAHGKHIVTIEGISPPGELNPLQQAMADEGATQCGFCTPGFVMSLAGFCLSDNEATHKNAIAAIDGNICRCTGYKSIERAAGKIAEIMKERNSEEPEDFVSKHKILPEYFATIKKQLYALATQTDGERLTAPDLPTGQAGSRLQTIAGGTDLYVQKHDEMTHADIRFVFNDPQLKGIRKEACPTESPSDRVIRAGFRRGSSPSVPARAGGRDSGGNEPVGQGNKCIIGPSVTVSDLKNSSIINEAFPNFESYSKLISSTPIRNMATIGGNFINASPIGDFTIFFLALNAQLVLSDGQTKRELSLRKLYKGYKQLDKRPEEFIDKIWFQLPGENALFHFEKVSKRTHLDIASVNSAISITMNGVRIANAGVSAGGVAPVPMYLQKTSEFLEGKKISEEIVHEAIEIAQTEISPISDARGTKEYKRLLLGQLIKAHFISLFPEIRVKLVLG
jgi:xanthine dehydrogenase small subunit